MGCELNYSLTCIIIKIEIYPTGIVPDSNARNRSCCLICVFITCDIKRYGEVSLPFHAISRIIHQIQIPLQTNAETDLGFCPFVTKSTFERSDTEVMILISIETELWFKILEKIASANL